MSLQEKTFKGIIWSFVDNFASQGVEFIVGIILARILTPHEFGLIGMLTVFIAISQTFIDSGFTNALIRKNNCTQKDYSTVFFFNISVSLFLYFILFASSESIGSFFKEPQLGILLKVLGLCLVFGSISMIQKTILTKEINFKQQTKISLFSSVTSGIIGILMALNGYGVWSLVGKALISLILSSILFWISSKWRPSFIFSKSSFKELFGFGSKLLISGLIDTVYNNIYYLIIGKYFSTKELGLYTRADQFKNIFSQNITSVIQRVSFPTLSLIKEDSGRLMESYQKLLRSTMFITFSLMFSMAAMSKSMIFTLVGEKWLPAAPYLELLCFVGIFYPLNSLNLNILNVKGRSDLFLRLEIIKKIIFIPVIVIGAFFGIKALILGMIFNSLLAYFINSYYSGRLIGYPVFRQINDIKPSFLIGMAVGILLYTESSFISGNLYIIFIIQCISAPLFILIFSEITQFKDYLFLKKIIFDYIFKNDDRER
jgi:O-antigen/teichoic acid export membrane protein